MSKGTKIPLTQATEMSCVIVQALLNKGIICQVCGSIRRKQTMVGDIDIICRYADDSEMHASLAAKLCLPGVTITRGGPLTMIGEFSGVRINLFAIHRDSWGGGLLFATGSGEFNIRMRARARKQGFKLNRYGLFDRDGNPAATNVDEESVFAALNMEWIPPENRNGSQDGSNNSVFREYSSASGNGTYRATLDRNTGRTWCTCPGFRYHGHCKHQELVQRDAGV